MPVPEFLRNLREKVGSDLIMLAGASAVVINDQGEVLLHQRTDNSQWALPGGIIEPGEELAESVVREVFEETGVEVVPERIVGVYGGKDHIAEYPNGDQVAFVSTVFLCRPVGGEVKINDDESIAVRYFSPDTLPQMAPKFHMRIEQALKNRAEAHFR